MPYDGNGTFTLVYNWINDASNGIDISSTRMMGQENDMATGLSTAVTKDGQTIPTANLPMAGFIHTGVGNGTLRDNYSAIGQIQDGGLIWGGTAAGTGNAITFNLTPTISAYTTGMVVRFIASAANTGATTMNINGVGVTSIKKLGTRDLQVGDIKSGQIVTVTYDGTNFQLQSKNESVIGRQTFSIAAAAMTPTTTNGATLTKTEISALQPNINALEFDPSTQQYAEFTIGMPAQWDEGTITAQFYWSHPSTTTNFGVVWNLAAVSVGTNSAIGTSYGTAQQIATTGGTTNNLYITSETPAITVAGTPAAGKMTWFKVSRVTGDASDNMAVNARLIGIELFINVDEGSDV